MDQEVSGLKPKAKDWSTVNRFIRVAAERVLIANAKSGGHAFIGLHLAKQLLKDGHSVTILNDEAKDKSKGPFGQYSQLESQGVKVHWGSPADASAIPEGDFDAVYDNNGKDMAACQAMIDHFKGKVKHYVFVGSAGAYVPDGVHAGHSEEDQRKKSAGHTEVENYLQSEGLPFTVFHPLYIYGPHTAKDCEQWVLDRVLRDRPVPLPAPGLQLTSISHVEDVANMMAKTVGNKQAIGQQFLCCSDRTLTFNGLVNICAKAAGKEPNIVHYDAKAMGLGKGEGIPFRNTHFFGQTDKAKRELGWQPQHTFAEDVADCIQRYKEGGRLDKQPDFSTDDKILAAAK